MASEEMWDKLFERVDKFADEVKAATDIAAEVEREAKSAADMARLARHIAVDADIVAHEALGLVFISYALKNPELARARKDSIIKTLKELLWNQKAVDGLDGALTEICDIVEKELLRRG